MAEALGKKFASNIFESHSAGTETEPHINQNAVGLLNNCTILIWKRLDFQSLFSISLHRILSLQWGCNVNCPYVPCKYREDWGLEDPTGKSDAEFIKNARVIENKILDLRQYLN